MENASLRATRRAAALVATLHIVALFVGFTVLAAVFQFPEVLRLPAAERLALFRDQQAIVQPVYWMLAMTGLTQVALAVLMYRSFRQRDTTTLALALTFGVLCGILQTAGFIRWAILVPYLAERMATADAAAVSVAIVEGAFNRYAGMALGEHTANLCLGAWTMLTGIALRREPLVDPRLGTVAIALGPVAALLALEQLGVAPALLGLVLDLGFPAWAVWLLVLAGSLWRSQPAGETVPRLGWRTALAAAALYAAMVAPALG